MLPVQQTGLNILLKKAYKEGMLARAAGRSPLAAVADIGAGGAPSAAAAEANMAALLEELELEEEGCVSFSGNQVSGFGLGLWALHQWRRRWRSELLS